MPRLEYADPTLSTDSRTQFARLPINLTRMLLHAPAETKGFLDLVSGFRGGALDPKQLLARRFELMEAWAQYAACSILR